MILINRIRYDGSERGEFKLAETAALKSFMGKKKGFIPRNVRRKPKRDFRGKENKKDNEQHMAISTPKDP